MMLRAIGCAIFTCAATMAAAQSGLDAQCWEVISPTIDGAPNSPILLNRCTGQTWIIVRRLLDGEPNGSFTYQWEGLYRTDGPPVLVTRPLP